MSLLDQSGVTGGGLDPYYVHALFVNMDKGCALLPRIHILATPRGTAQIDDVSIWLPPSLETPWRNVFLYYVNNMWTEGFGNYDCLVL